MFFRIFDLPDAVALTRALIPWTAAILRPEDSTEAADLLQRTNMRQPQPDAESHPAVRYAELADTPVSREEESDVVSWLGGLAERLRHHAALRRPLPR